MISEILMNNDITIDYPSPNATDRSRMNKAVLRRRIFHAPGMPLRQSDHSTNSITTLKLAVINNRLNGLNMGTQHESDGIKKVIQRPLGSALYARPIRCNRRHFNGRKK
jgi:hypothetical protein